MIIILEGPDGVGKSTLANDIIRYLSVKCPNDRVELIHRGPPTGSPLDEYAVPLIGYQPGMGVHLILDRWHWGEMIYPKVFGRRTSMTKAMFAYLEQLIDGLGGVTINMPLTDRTVRDFEERGDDLIKSHQLADIAQAYAKLFVHSLTGRIVAHYTASHAVWAAQGHERQAKERNERKWNLTSKRVPDEKSIRTSSTS